MGGAGIGWIRLPPADRLPGSNRGQADAGGIAARSGSHLGAGARPQAGYFSRSLARLDIALPCSRFCGRVAGVFLVAVLTLRQVIDMASLIQVLFPRFNPSPTAENAGIRPSQTVEQPDLKKADEELRRRLERIS